MPDATAFLARAGARTRLRGHQLRTQAHALRSPRQTALRLPGDRVVPTPSEFLAFGAGSWIVPPARVSGARGIEIGAGVTVLEDSGLFVDVDRGARLVIGSRTRLSKGAEVVCTIGVTIGVAVSASDYVTITDGWLPFGAATEAGGQPAPPGAPIEIEDGAYLGWGCVIGPGARIGRGAYVGEGACVVGEVAPHSVVYGNPATLVRALDPATGAWVGTRFP